MVAVPGGKKILEIPPKYTEKEGPKPHSHSTQGPEVGGWGTWYKGARACLQGLAIHNSSIMLPRRNVGPG